MHTNASLESSKSSCCMHDASCASETLLVVHTRALAEFSTTSCSTCIHMHAPTSPRAPATHAHALTHELLLHTTSTHRILDEPVRPCVVARRTDRAEGVPVLARKHAVHGVSHRTGGAPGCFERPCIIWRRRGWGVGGDSHVLHAVGDIGSWTTDLERPGYCWNEASRETHPFEPFRTGSSTVSPPCHGCFLINIATIQAALG